MKWIGALIFSCALVGLLYLYPSDSVQISPNGSEQASSKAAQGSSGENITPQRLTIAQRTPQGERKPWRRVGAVPPEDLPRLRQDVARAEFVSLDHQQIASYEKGDAFKLEIPQLNNAYFAKIEQVKRTPSGNRVLRARIPNTPHSLVITQGKKSLFATISTPEGIFNMSGNSEYAWVIAARELNHHVDHSVPDYVVYTSGGS